MEDYDSAYEKGIEGEKELVEYLFSNGYAAIRAPGSGRGTQNPQPDVFCSNGQYRFAIELKTRKEHGQVELRHKQLTRLFRFAELAGAIPLVVIRYDDRDVWYCYEVDESPPENSDSTLELQRKQVVANSITLDWTLESGETKPISEISFIDYFHRTKVLLRNQSVPPMAEVKRKPSGRRYYTVSEADDCYLIATNSEAMIENCDFYHKKHYPEQDTYLLSTSREGVREYLRNLGLLTESREDLRISVSNNPSLNDLRRQIEGGLCDSRDDSLAVPGPSV